MGPKFLLCCILASFAGVPGRGPPSVMSGLSILVQPVEPASLIEFLCEQ